ncbi:hypothetical protein PAT3040_07153 [Paenibacillus agaridevorans]|uniref:Uncharacterized protein n=1 Tax=Paenibacillus agaridevorans TaxID=171404 RepID=A0A2R5F6P4_9BACL|nr:hypothetical protein PAT3040_07153 [Paenibacillus agaridevorans]
MKKSRGTSGWRARYFPAMTGWRLQGCAANAHTHHINVSGTSNSFTIYYTPYFIIDFVRVYRIEV